jgi:short chain dehydrogenase
MLLAPFGANERDEHRRMVETNLLGAMTATEVFLDQLRGGGGDLVNVSSVAGRFAPAGFAVYAATKWGINGWSESLRLELQPNIRVIVIEPGAVATELTDHITHADSKRAAQEATAATHIEPEDIADVIAFAVSRPQRVALSEILVRPRGVHLFDPPADRADLTAPEFVHPTGGQAPGEWSSRVRVRVRARLACLWGALTRSMRLSGEDRVADQAGAEALDYCRERRAAATRRSPTVTRETGGVRASVRRDYGERTSASGRCWPRVSSMRAPGTIVAERVAVGNQNGDRTDDGIDRAAAGPCWADRSDGVGPRSLSEVDRSPSRPGLLGNP